jgi:hypothetical protein
MKQLYVVYEVWTTARLIEAEDAEDAYNKGEPPKRVGLNLCNWHVVPLPAVDALIAALEVEQNQTE